MKLGIICPVWKRHSLAHFTLKNNLKFACESGFEVEGVAMISEPEARAAVPAGWIAFEAPNSPLSSKFQAGLDYARTRECDLVMVIGSDDLIHRRVFKEVRRIAESKMFASWGVKDCYVLNGITQEVGHFQGYPEGEREGESIGTCRTFSRSYLDEIDWQLWPLDVERGCDLSMRLPSPERTCMSTMEQSGPVLDIKAFPLYDIGTFNSMDTVETDETVETLFGPKTALSIKSVIDPVENAEILFDHHQKPFISACLLVKNEEEGIGKALCSLVGVADEVCVLDTGSTDRTVAIAEAYGARVKQCEAPMPFEFDIWRNKSVQMGRGEWILIMDGDEFLITGKSFQEEVHSIPENATCVAFRHKILGKNADSGNKIMRLLDGDKVRDGSLSYVYPAHHQLRGLEKFIVLESALTCEPEFDATGSAKRAIETLAKRLMILEGTKPIVGADGGKVSDSVQAERHHCLLYLARSHCIVGDSFESGSPESIVQFERAALYAGKLIDEGGHSPVAYLTLLIAVERAKNLLACTPFISQAFKHFPNLKDLFWWEMRVSAAMLAVLESQPDEYPLAPQRGNHYMPHLRKCEPFLFMKFYDLGRFNEDQADG